MQPPYGKTVISAQLRFVRNSCVWNAALEPNSYFIAHYIEIAGRRSISMKDTPQIDVADTVQSFWNLYIHTVLLQVWHNWLNLVSVSSSGSAQILYYPSQIGCVCYWIESNGCKSRTASAFKFNNCKSFISRVGLLAFRWKGQWVLVFSPMENVLIIVVTPTALYTATSDMIAFTSHLGLVNEPEEPRRRWPAQMTDVNFLF